MARVGNRKVRTGCLRCKLRHVKCDEQRPACGWCKDHSLKCEYPLQPRTKIRHLSSSALSQSPSPSKSGNTPNVNDNSNISSRSQLELGLLQYYIVSVAPSFPSFDRERALELHADMIPQEALRCSCLLNAVYSYALLHMHIKISVHGKLPRNAAFFEEQGVEMKHQNAEDPSKVDLLTLHRDYLDVAIQEQRGMVTDINQKNADGICVTAILLAMIILIHSAQVNKLEEYAIPIDWFILQASFSPCLETALPLLTLDSATSALIHSPPVVDNRGLDYRKYNIFRALVEWESPIGVDDVHQHREAYETALAYIQTIYKRIAEKEPWESLGRRILAFPNVVPNSFATLLQQGQPRALVMLAHLVAMMRRLDSLWWIFNGVADFHVRGIATLVPEDWQWALAWPLKVLDTNGADSCFVL